MPNYLKNEIFAIYYYLKKVQSEKASELSQIPTQKT